jgi:hypothetical protein
MNPAKNYASHLKQIITLNLQGSDMFLRLNIL